MTRCVVVITGPRAASKTIISRSFSACFGYDHVNVGDQLIAARIHASHRSEIGRLFLDAFGMEGYVDCIVTAARPGVLLAKRAWNTLEPLSPLSSGAR